MREIIIANESREREREKGREQRSGTARNIGFKFPQGRKESQRLIETVVLSFHLDVSALIPRDRRGKKKRRGG